jgi:ribosomal peptide maturation radical SAM protein 1
MATSSAAEAERPQTKRLRVALICMPFYGASRPSIQLGLLQAIGRAAGHLVDTFHLNLELAAELTPNIYEALSNHRGHFTGDWLASFAAFSDAAPSSPAQFFAAFPNEIKAIERQIGIGFDELAHLRLHIIPNFISRCLAQYNWSHYDVIGFSSTFQQNTASFALARRIKEMFPRIAIVFGGANFGGTMGLEYIKGLHFIDFMVAGEADETFPALLEHIGLGTDPSVNKGIACRKSDGTISWAGPARPVDKMDDIPTPHYDEYFTRAHALGFFEGTEYPPVIPIESARGCWWGAKHHCTFCGLNNLGMTFRAKSPSRLMEELCDLSRRYRSTFFADAGNIMDMRLLKDLFPSIARSGYDFTFFFEVKSNLRSDQIKVIADGGVRRVQAGIESLNSNVLKLMRKGVTQLQNVRFLKWARYYDVSVGWNLIRGFPGETVADYDDQLRVLKAITHLEPPSHLNRIWLERFAPYFDGNCGFPISNIVPESSYNHVYPSDLFSIENIAYFFERRMGETVECDSQVVISTNRLIDSWLNAWKSLQPDRLTYRKIPGAIFIDDARLQFPSGTYTYEGVIADIYLACGDIATIDGLMDTLSLSHSTASPELVRHTLEQFCSDGLMLRENSSYLSLALPANPNYVPVSDYPSRASVKAGAVDCSTAAMG